MGIPNNSPSSIELTMACAASRWLNKIAIRQSDFVADEGTAAHTLSEMCFHNQTWPEHHIGEMIHVNDRSFQVDGEMARHTRLYVESVRQYVVPGTIFEVENSIQVPEIGCTAGKVDALVYNPYQDHLLIDDLKYGAGMLVEPTAPQVIVYALGARRHFHGITGATKVTLCIAQPRYNHTDGPVRYYHTTMGALEDYMWRYLVPAHEASKDPTKLTFNVGKHCVSKFCSGKAICPAFYHELMRLAGIPLDKEGVIIREYDGAAAVPKLSTAQLDGLYDYMPALEKMKKQALAELKQRVKSGDNIDRCKVTNSNTYRKFKASQEVIAQTLATFLPDVSLIFEPRKLKSVTAVKEMFPNKKLAETVMAPLIEESSNGPTIMNSAAKRKDLGCSALRATGNMGAVNGR